MKVNKSLSGTVFLFKANGNALSVEQAKEYLQKFGPVQKAWTPSDTEQEMFGLPSGVFVRFMYYDHCQEALEVRNALFSASEWKCADFIVEDAQ